MHDDCHGTLNGCVMANDTTQRPPPILAAKHHDAPSVFAPENLLREARRQKGLVDAPVPRVCVLDPDGDIVQHLRARQRNELPDVGLLPYADGRSEGRSLRRSALTAR